MDVQSLITAATSGGGNTPAQNQVQQALANLAAAGALGPAAANGADSGNPLAFLQSMQIQQQASQQTSQPGQAASAESLAAAAQYAAAAQSAAAGGQADYFAALSSQAGMSGHMPATGGAAAMALQAFAAHQAGQSGALAGQMAGQLAGMDMAPRSKGKGKGKIDDPIYIALSTAMAHLQEAATVSPPQNEGWDFETLKVRLTKYFRSAAKGMTFSNRSISELINEFADSAFGNISWLLAECKWLRQADFTLVLEVSVNELFPLDVKSGVDKSEMEEYVVKANDRAIEEAAFTPVLDKIVKASVHGKKAQNKLYQAAETARKEAIIASSQDADNKPKWPWEATSPLGQVKAFVQNMIYHTLKPFGDWPDSVFSEEECIKFFSKLVQEGAVPTLLTRHLSEPIPDPWDYLREAIHEIYDKAAKKNEELELTSKSKKKKVFSPEENHLYKTEICRNWQMTGSCKMSEWCVFAHGEPELLYYQAKASGKGSSFKGLLNPMDHWREMPGKGKKGFGLKGPGAGFGGLDSFDGFDGFNGLGQNMGGLGPNGFGYGKASAKGCGKGLGPKGCMGLGKGAPGIRGKGVVVPPPGMASGPPLGMASGPPPGMASGPPPGMASGPPPGMASGSVGLLDMGMQMGGEPNFQMLQEDESAPIGQPVEQAGQLGEQPWDAGLAPPGLEQEEPWGAGLAPPGLADNG